MSIVLPTFNRADVIGRAIASVVQQTFGDWELLIVDDGSSDDTTGRVSSSDQRIVVLRQDNAGVYVARNHGLAKARGRWITFLDSDDEWAPHFLELTTAFLRGHPDEHFVTTEFWEDWGAGPRLRHDLSEVSSKYPAMARRVGSSLFQLPPGESDDYLRVYSEREPVGDWGRDVVARVGTPAANLYRGRIFPHMRFGYLNWLPITVLTRHALETIGPFATHARSAADYRFLCQLARAFRANMIAVPSATKFDRAVGAQALKQGHLATGQGQYRFETNFLAFFDEMFANPMRGDPEIERLRRYYSLNAGRAALRLGKRHEAREHLRSAACWRKRLWWAYVGLAFAGTVPSDRWAGGGYRAAARAFDVGKRIADGTITPASALRRLVRGRLRR